MSTYWGYRCITHEPELDSEKWFNHGKEVLRDAFEKERAGEWPDVDEDHEIHGYNPEPVRGMGLVIPDPIYWLRRHPYCDIILVSEYGDTESLENIPKVYLAAARAYCLDRYNYNPESYIEGGREAHIMNDARSTARESWLGKVVDAVLAEAREENRKIDG